MTNNFSHLVVNGCSLTVCAGLDNPAEQGWPKLIADKLGIPLINLAKSGSGNDYILRTTVEHVYKNPLHNPLYIVAFSHSSRREEYCAEIKTYDQLHINYKPFNELTYYEKGYALNYDPIDRVKVKINLWLGVVNTLRANKISYLTTDYIPELTQDIDELSKSYGELITAVNNDPNRLVDFEFLTRGMPKLPCGHEDLPAMQILADYTYKEIQKRWH
jgi:hypothetical protein